MSRDRIQRAVEDLYARHSPRIAKALQVGEIDFYAYAVLSFLIDAIDLPGREGEAIYTLAALAEALDWPLHPDILRRRLYALRDAGWLSFAEPRRGPGAAYTFRLTGAAIDGKRDESETSFHPSFHSGDPSPVETISTEPGETLAANSQPERIPDGAEFPPRARAEQSRAETEKENLCSEGRKENNLGKTTADEPELAEAQLAEEFSPERPDEHEANPFHGEERRSPRLFDEEIHDLGTASLAELRRRHESGEI